MIIALFGPNIEIKNQVILALTKVGYQHVKEMPEGFNNNESKIVLTIKNEEERKRLLLNAIFGGGIQFWFLTYETYTKQPTDQWDEKWANETISNRCIDVNRKVYLIIAKYNSIKRTK